MEEYRLYIWHDIVFFLISNIKPYTLTNGESFGVTNLGLNCNSYMWHFMFSSLAVYAGSDSVFARVFDSLIIKHIRRYFVIIHVENNYMNSLNKYLILSFSYKGNLDLDCHVGSVCFYKLSFSLTQIFIFTCEFSILPVR